LRTNTANRILIFDALLVPNKLTFYFPRCLLHDVRPFRFRLSNLFFAPFSTFVLLGIFIVAKLRRRGEWEDFQRKSEFQIRVEEENQRSAEEFPFDVPLRVSVGSFLAPSGVFCLEEALKTQEKPATVWALPITLLTAVNLIEVVPSQGDA